MGEIPLLNELALVAAIGVVVTVVLAKLHLPTVAGLLVAGALIGPSGFGVVAEVHDIEVLSEVGVVLLLFTIGLEFSLSRLRSIFRQVALGGLIQVGLTFAGAVAVALWLKQPFPRAIFYGFAVALSSTAIVLRTLVERNELDAPHGRFIVGTLIFQDLCVIPMVLIVPLLGSSTAASSLGFSLFVALAKAAAVVVATVALARVVVPRLLNWVDASRSREVFLLAIIALCIGTAWVTSLAGLSLALGAFLGGMVVADTEYGHRAMSDILPLRDVFVSLFFVALGMLFDAGVVVSQPLAVFGILSGLILVKGVIATIAALVMRFPARAAWLAGVGLAQFGEFGFVLTRIAQDHGVIDAATASPLLTAGILSMFVTPLLVRAAPHITAGERLLQPLERMFGVRSIDQVEDSPSVDLRDHVVIVGFGVAGSLATHALQALGIPVIALDLSIKNVRRGRAMGLPVFYGDATSEEALRHARVPFARKVVLIVNDQRAAERVVNTIRRIAPDTRIMIRTRYALERDALLRAGAHDVVVEEVEGAVEVVSRMLRQLDVPRNIIDDRVRALRAESNTSEREVRLPRKDLSTVAGLGELKIESLIVLPDSPAVGRSAVQLDLRNQTGAMVVGVRRDERLLQPPDPNEAFAIGDTVFLVGNGDAMHAVLRFFDPGDENRDQDLA